MSRLFTRLENIGQESNDKETEPLPDAQEAARSQAEANQPDPSVPSAVPAPPPLVPGYVGAPSHAAASLPEARPVWTVRLWFASLLLLVALSLAVLLMPRQQLAAPQRPAAVVQDLPAAVAPASQKPAAVVAPAPSAAAAPASRPTARTEAVPEAPRPAAPGRATAPAASTASCTEAMLALNLCATPSP